jgi:hypothetical protein
MHTLADHSSRLPLHRVTDKSFSEVPPPKEQVRTAAPPHLSRISRLKQRLYKWIRVGLGSACWKPPSEMKENTPGNEANE